MTDGLGLELVDYWSNKS